MHTLQLTSIEQTIGYHFNNQDLLRQALTHSSYANEIDQTLENNERLEFLGDAVLELCVSQELFLRFPDEREGVLTCLRAQLVSEAALADTARHLGLQQYLLLGKGEENQGGRERNSILCDVLESLFGAVFLDGGFSRVNSLILELLSKKWPKSGKFKKNKDFKSRLQEITQKLFSDRPRYTLQDSFGPEHEKTYAVRLSLPNGQHYHAEAGSVKKAEQLAAQKALHDLTNTGSSSR
mgnify:CR=1 FL=1